MTLRPRILLRSALAVAAVLAPLTSGCDKEAIERGARPVIVVDDQLVFSDTPLGTSSFASLYIENSGDATLVLEDWSIRGSTSEFDLPDFEAGMTVEPGDSLSLTVEYRPTDEVADSGVLTLFNNSTNAPEAQITLTTGGEVSNLVADPTELVFTGVSIGATGELALDVYNVGTRSAALETARLVLNTGGFTIVSTEPALPAQVAPDQKVTFTIRYEPSSGGVDNENLLIECDANNCRDGRFIVPISAVADQPRLRVTPGDVAFGAVPLNPSPAPTQVVTARNEGQGALEIRSIAWALNPADGDDEIQIVSVGGEAWDANRTDPWVLAPDETLEVVLRYAPADAEPDLENLVFRSNDAGLPIQSVRVAGVLSAPRIEVTPTVLEFPYTAITLSVEREIIVRNAGAEPLTLDPLLIRGGGFDEGQFTVVNEADFPAELGAGEEFRVRVEFAPTIPDFAFAGTIYVLPTNDPLTPEVRVEVSGQSASEPVCELRALPGTINFGTVPRGTLREQSARIRNIGSGPCTIQRVTELPGGGFGGLFGNDYFDLVGTDRPIPTELLPGDELEVTASYFPLTSTDLSEAFGDTGSIQIDARDPSDGGAAVRCGVPGFGASWTCGLNLQARSGVAEIAVIPSDFDAGPVTLGCNSQTETIRVYNTGNADIVVTGVATEDCTTEFAVAGVPAMPVTLGQGDSFAFQVRYSPSSEGADACAVVVTTETAGSERTVVPLAGEGVTYSRTVDRFEQSTGREVDVLFVVDNSGSMSEEQSNLSRNFGSFIAEARTWDIDFQIGIVTTQTEDSVPDPTGPDRQPGELLGSTRIITPATPSYEAVFSRQVEVGTEDTTASSTERGLEAAQLALSDPLITDFGTPCTSDADCTAPYLCVAAAAGSPRACGGYNRTFLREDASLEIVFVSDEEDSSRAELSFYVDFLKSIKGFRNASLMHASAIVGPSGGCSSGSGTADAGNRYLDVAAQTGGLVGSICDANFSSTLAAIGDRAFGVRVQFFLTRAADASTVQVFDVPCSGTTRTPRTGWTFDAASNSVVFTEATAPTPGSCFEVEYEAACF